MRLHRQGDRTHIPTVGPRGRQKCLREPRASSSIGLACALRCVCCFGQQRRLLGGRRALHLRRDCDRGDRGLRRLPECWWRPEPGHPAPLFGNWWLREPGHLAPLFADMSAGDATAAAAAAQAAQAVLDTSESYRRSDVLRTLIQKPDIFRPETREQEVEQWSEWKHTMRNYLSVVDSKMLDDMETIEAVPARASTIKGMEPAVRKRSIELYAILLSFV